MRRDGQMPRGAAFAEAFSNNTCILDGGEYLSLAGFNVSDASTWTIGLGNNTLAGTLGAARFCVDVGGDVMNMSAWARLGIDNGTRVIDLPASAAIVAMLAAAVGLN